MPDDAHNATGAAWTVAGLIPRMEDRGDAPAVVTVRDGKTEAWSFGELSQTVRCMVGGLTAAGFEPGEAAAIHAPNAPEWIAAALALNTAGALVVPVDDLLGEAHARALVVDSGARWIFTTRAHLAALGEIPGRESFRIYLLDTDEDEGGARAWRRLLAEQPAAIPELNPDQPLCLFYTSGTTGPSKGFVLTHANVGTNVRALAAEGLVGLGDRALLPLPLHHAYPYIVGMLTSMETGMAIVLPQSVTGPHVADALRAARVTVVVGVPRLYEALLAGIEARIARGRRLAKRLFSWLIRFCAWLHRCYGIPAGPWLFAPLRRRIAPKLRLLISGGARLEADLSWTLQVLGWQVLAGYGLAETSSVFTGNLPRRRKLGSAGTPLDGGEIRIAKPDEKGIGEIELKGASITSGYRNNTEANRAAFTDDRWFRTGDLGYLDSDGFLFVTGRAKEAIVLGGGKKVNPEEVEKIYAGNPVIREIAVLERGGQLVGLVRPDPDRLREIGTMNVDHAVRVALAEAAGHLPAYERLAGFAIAQQPLPRTQLGKYRRFLLPELYDEAKKGIRRRPAPELSAEDKRFLEDPLAARAWKLVAERYADKGVTLDSHLALDLGVDSLEWMTLSLELEGRLGVALAEDDLARIETVRDLVTAAARAKEKPATAREPEDAGRWLAPLGPGLRAAGAALYGINKILMRSIFRLRVDGIERLPRSGAFVLVPNHVSDLDPLAVAAALPFEYFRRTYWAGDVVRLFRNAFLRAVCRAVRLYPVDERRPASAIETAARVLARGDIQVWFPESWRSPDGKLQRFLPGIGELLVKSGARAVPVYISGTFEAMPRTRRFPRAHPIRVVIGDPVAPEELAARGRGEREQECVASGLQEAVRRLAAGIGDDV